MGACRFKVDSEVQWSWMGPENPFKNYYEENQRRYISNRVGRMWEGRNGKDVSKSVSQG